MTVILPGDALWPRLLKERLGDAAPTELTTLGNLDLLALPKTGLFCSARCPGNVFLSTYDHRVDFQNLENCRLLPGDEGAKPTSLNPTQSQCARNRTEPKNNSLGAIVLMPDWIGQAMIGKSTSG